MSSNPTHVKRGGLAAGDPNNPAIPTGTSYNAFPPKSTYTGPTVAGSEDGFILTVVFSGLAFFGVLGLGWWFVRRRHQRRNGHLRIHSHSNIIGTSSKGWKPMPDDEEGEATGMYGADAFEMDPNFGLSMVSLQLDQQASPPPSHRNDPFETPYTPTAHSLNTPSSLLDPSSPASPGYQAVMKHRAPSPSKEQTD